MSVIEHFYLLTVKSVFGEINNRFKDRNDALEYAERMRQYLSAYGAVEWALYSTTKTQILLEEGNTGREIR